jgi:hypothetical protein
MAVAPKGVCQVAIGFVGGFHFITGHQGEPADESQALLDAARRGTRVGQIGWRINLIRGCPVSIETPDEHDRSIAQLNQLDRRDRESCRSRQLQGGRFNDGNG